MILDIGHEYDFNGPDKPTSLIIWFKFSYGGVSRKAFIERRLYDIEDPARLRRECADAANEIIQVAWLASPHKNSSARSLNLHQRQFEFCAFSPELVGEIVRLNIYARNHAHCIRSLRATYSKKLLVVLPTILKSVRILCDSEKVSSISQQ